MSVEEQSPTFSGNASRVLAAIIVANTTKTMHDHLSGMGLADIQVAHTTIQAACAHALLYVGDQIAEQVEVQRQQLEQQRLANVIAAFQAGIATEDAWLEMGYDDTTAAAAWVRARIGEIVIPESDTGQ